MKEYEMQSCLCKMQGEVADSLGLKTLCVCNSGHRAMEGEEVPDEVIDELWALIADGRLFRYLRDFFAVERPKGRRINVEEYAMDSSLKEFARRESARAERNGRYASYVEVALMDARKEIESLKKELEELKGRS